MKKIIYLALTAFLTFAFISCSEDDGPTSNEDFAGEWFLDAGSEVYKLDLTDSTFVQSKRPANSATYTNFLKGSVKKLSATTIEVLPTDDWVNDAWVASGDTKLIQEYSVASDRSTLTLDAYTWSSTEP